jgi:outer membrane beta-barrel protein
MESRFRIFLLTITLLLMPLAQAATTSPPADPGQGEQLNQIIQQEPVIQPDIKRREITEAKIHSQDFELGLFTGLLSIEDFGSKPVVGARLTYHVTEDFFFEGTYGMSEGGPTSADNFVPPLLSADQRQYTFYTTAIGYNVLPGESFLGRSNAFNSSLFLVAGIGSTNFGGDNRFTAMYGAGYRVIIKQWLSLQGNLRDHLYSIDVTGKDKVAHNIEISLGINYLF